MVDLVTLGSALVACVAPADLALESDELALVFAVTLSACAEPLLAEVTLDAEEGTGVVGMGGAAFSLPVVFVILRVAGSVVLGAIGVAVLGILGLVLAAEVAVTDANLAGGLATTTDDFPRVVTFWLVLAAFAGGAMLARLGLAGVTATRGVALGLIEKTGAGPGRFVDLGAEDALWAGDATPAAGGRVETGAGALEGKVPARAAAVAVAVAAEAAGRAQVAAGLGVASPTWGVAATWVAGEGSWPILAMAEDSSSPESGVA